MNDFIDILNYWRNSLVDAEKIKPANITREIQTETKQVFAGVLPKEIVDKVYDMAIKLIKKGDEEKPDLSKGIAIMISPFYYHIINSHTQNYVGDSDIYPLWLPAKIFNDGHLEPNNDQLPWIPRNYLNPSADIKSSLIGQLSDLENFLIGNQLDDFSSDWRKIQSFSMRMYEAVIVDSIEYYKKIEKATIMVDNLPSNTITHIISALDFLIKKKQKPELFQTLSCIHTREEKPLLSSELFIKYSLFHLGQMSYEFPLSESQREALHYSFDTQNSEILAINGPPGTGKTTLIHSVIASMWVKAAYERIEPPIIVISSATNQAVTNVIDSFSRVFNEKKLTSDKELSIRFQSFIKSPGSIEQLATRWLPDIHSYGLYLSSKEGFKSNQNKEWQITNTYGDGFPSRENDQKYIDDGVSFFIEKANNYFGKNFENIDIAIKYIYRELKQTVESIKNVVDLRLNLLKLTEAIFDKYSDLDRNRDAEPQLHIEILTLQEQLTKLDNDYNELYNQCSTSESIINCYNNAFREWKKYKKRCTYRLYIFFAHGKRLKHLHKLNDLLVQEKIIGGLKDIKLYPDGITVEQVEQLLKTLINNETSLHDSIKEEKDTNLLQKEQLEKQLNELKNCKLKLEKTRYKWEKCIKNYDLSTSEEKWMETLDITLRFLAFLWATHYWEVEWLKKSQELIKKNQKKNNYLNTVKDKFYRYAMLTPGMVATLYMLPGYFKYYDGEANIPCIDFIDLLIIDESGQVVPDVASVSFALSKRAVILGDVLQIEPVWSIPEHVDIGNLKRQSIIKNDKDFLRIIKRGITSSKNSLMELAQNACKYHKIDSKGNLYPERGMFLCEHHRCDNKIIQICNELAYRGRLIPLKKEIKLKNHLPAIGYFNIDGRSEKQGTSRKNKIEAEEIIKWITDKQQDLLNTYGENVGSQNIKDIIAILTPFKAQAKLITDIIKENPRFASLSNITIGTVHTLQGSEREVIIFSPVYSKNDKITFMLDNGPNLLNVAISRARSSFLVFGNISILNGKYSKVLFQHLKENGTPLI